MITQILWLAFLPVLIFVAYKIIARAVTSFDEKKL